VSRLSRIVSGVALPAAACLAFAVPASAGTPISVADHIAQIEARLAEQSARLDAQERRLAGQSRLIEFQSAELRGLRTERDQLLEAVRAGQRSPAGSTELAQVAPVNPGLPDRPVGEAPPQERLVQVAAIPERMGVLTTPGHLILEPSFEYVRSSANRLVFRGVEIVPGIQLGVIEADNADRDTLVGAISATYGLTDRLELQARAPYVYRHDRIQTLGQRDDTQTRDMSLQGQEIGDVEVSARYQLNDGRGGRPIFVAEGRVKPPTGRGPFDVGYNEAGIATDLATGSGFWAAEGGVTMLYPTDPAVIFGGLTYVHSFARDIDKTIGEVRVGKVTPGDSIGANLGFGLALNPRFSVSLGYSHNYIFPTKTVLGGTEQGSNPLQVGSILMGWSFRLTDHVTLSNNFEFGVTTDSPDMRVVFRAPYRF
jgi:hypothetical protein